MKGRFFLTLPLLTLVACGTINMGTLAYAEFDPVKREYPEKREGTLKQSKCGLMAVPAQLNMGASFFVRVEPADFVVLSLVMKGYS
jgi:hypothetical protein